MMTDPTNDLPPAGWHELDGAPHYWDGQRGLQNTSSAEPAAVGAASAIGFDDLHAAQPTAGSSATTRTASTARPGASYAHPVQSSRRGLPTLAVVTITAVTTAALMVGGYFTWQWFADASKREDIAAVEQTIADAVRIGEQTAPAPVDDVTCTRVNDLLATSILRCTVTLADGAGTVPWYAWTNHDTGETWHSTQPHPLIASAWD